MARASPQIGSMGWARCSPFAISFGQFKDHVAIAVFRKLIEDCYVSDLRIDGARGRQEAGHGGRSARGGDDLVVAAKYIFNNYPDIFQEIIKKIGERIPGVEKIEAQATQDMNAAAIGATSR